MSNQLWRFTKPSITVNRSRHSTGKASRYV